MLNDRDRQSVT